MPLFRLLQAGGTAQVNNLLQRNGVRERLADALCSELGLETKRLCELKRSEREALVKVGGDQCLHLFGLSRSRVSTKVLTFDPLKTLGVSHAAPMLTEAGWNTSSR